MPAGLLPEPFDLYFGANGFLNPPKDIMASLRDNVQSDRAVPWFPERVQQTSVSERVMPPKSETAFTVRDRSGGYGHSEWPDDWQDGQPGVYAYTDAVDVGGAGDGQGVDCSVEGVAFLAPFLNQVGLPAGNGPLGGHFELTLAGTRYQFVVMGTQMYQSSDCITWASTIPGSSTAMPTLAAPLTGRPCVFTGTQSGPRVYFPEGQGTVAQLWDGVAVALTNLAALDNNKWIDCRVVEDATWALWYDTLSLRYRLNKMQDGGASPSWYPSYAISDGSDPAQAILYIYGQIFVGCRLHLKQIADDLEGGQQTLLSTQDNNTNNFKWWDHYQDELWFNAGGATWRIVPARFARQITTLKLEQIGPEVLSNNRTPVQGTVMAKANDNFCEYLFVQNAEGVTYLLKHRKYLAEQREATHCLERIGSYSVGYAFTTTVGDGPRLIFGLTNTSVGMIVLPKNGFYPPADPRCQFCTKGALFESRQYGGMTFITKVLLAWTGRSQDASATEVITPYQRVTSSGAFAGYGGAISNDPGGRLSLSAPVVAESWWENQLQFQRGGTSSETPKLLAATTNFNLKPVGKGLFTMYVWIADYSTLRSGQRDWRAASDVLAQVRALRNQVGTPSILVDDTGTTYQVMIDDVDIFTVYSEADEHPEKVAKVTATEWATIARGTWGALSRFTWGQLASYTWGQLNQLG
jgi:hypothetical protein